MCGIFACVSHKSAPTDKINRIGKDLMLFSEWRGKEASGIAGVYAGKIKVLRTGEKASFFVREKKYQNFLAQLAQESEKSPYYALLGHTRLATNGAQTIHTNNQPVVTSSSLGIHNGMIVNDTQIWKKYPNLHRELTVDTEVFLKLAEHFVAVGDALEQAIAKTYHEIIGATSIIFMHKLFPKLVIATNTGSLYIAVNNNMVICASEKFLLQQIDNIYHLDFPEISQLKPNQAATIELNGGKINFFDLQHYLYKIRARKNATAYFSITAEDIVPSFFYAQDLCLNKLSDLQTHIPRYAAIKKIRRCARCILPQTMPLITFDENGICNFCNSSRRIRYQGKQALEKIIAPYKKHKKQANCIVALSGGRDSSFGLHYAKTVLKLNPIAYTYDWGMVTDIARRNQYRLTAELGVEHIIVSADISRKREFIKKNVEAWLHKPNLAMIPLFMAGDKQAEYYCEQVRRRTGIDLIIYCRGNELEDERFKFGYYGIFDGTPGGVLHNLSAIGKLQMATYYAREYTRNPRYLNASLLDTAGAYFSAYLMQHKFLYLWHYIPWNETEIISTLKGKYAWETPTDTIATWRIDDGTPPFYNYIYYQVQGFTEHDALRSNQIRQGVISRSQALKLVYEENKPRYEALKWYFDAIKINGSQALAVTDQMPTLY